MCFFFFKQCTIYFISIQSVAQDCIFFHRSFCNLDKSIWSSNNHYSTRSSIHVSGLTCSLNFDPCKWSLYQSLTSPLLLHRLQIHTIYIIWLTKEICNHIKVNKKSKLINCTFQIKLISNNLYRTTHLQINYHFHIIYIS